MAALSTASPRFLTSIFIPHPVNIHVTSNTFVQLEDGVGLVLEVIAEEWKVKVRKFLSHHQLLSYVSNIIDGYTISFWPQQTDYPPLYLCDSDITNVISASSIIGLAFVFHEDDPIVGEVSGVSNTYVVSSRFNSSQMLIQHSTSFSRFPSRAFPLILPSCLPSTMFKQLLSIK